MKFPEQPDIAPLPEGLYCLRSNYIYEDSHNYIFIKKGFIHDGASAPRIAWTLSGLTPDGVIRAAALVHDYLYRCRKDYSKARADELFLTIMQRSGVTGRRRRLAYWGVKFFGHRSFKQARATK